MRSEARDTVKVALDAPALVRRMILTGTGPAGGVAAAAVGPRIPSIRRMSASA